MIRSLHDYEMKIVCAAMEYKPTENVRSVAIVEKRKVLAAVLYDHWCYNSVNAHVYSVSPKGLLNPDFIREIFRYPFDLCGRGVMLAITPGDAPSLPVARALGFRETYRIKDGWKVGIDLVVQEMTKNECKWIQAKAA